MLSDFDTLLEKCRSKDARKNAQEAVKCWQSGAYRAAIVSIWTATVFDLVDKIFELALTGDAEAVAIKTKIENYRAAIEMGDPNGIKRALEFERDIIETCQNKLKLLDSIKATHLRRAQDDRNICAHPTYSADHAEFSPSAEIARAHIQHCISYVLSQPPLQGVAAADRIEKAILSAYFPKQENEANEALDFVGANSTASAKVLKLVCDRLLFGFFESDSPHKDRDLTIVALHALVSINSELLEAHFKKQFEKCMQKADDSDLFGLYKVIVSVDAAQMNLTDAFKVRAFNHIESHSEESRTLLYSVFYEIASLRGKIIELIPNMSAKSISALAEGHGKDEVVADRAMELYVTRQSFDDTNMAWNHALKKSLAGLQKKHIDRLCDALENFEGDLLGAHSFPQFVSELKQQRPELHAILVARSPETHWHAYMP